MKRLAMTLIAVLSTAMSVVAQDSLNIQKVGQLFDWTNHLWSFSYDIKVRDTLAFVATGNSGVRVLNLADSSRPEEISFMPFYIQDRCEVTSIELEGNRCYGIIKKKGVGIYDISLGFTRQPPPLALIDSLVDPRDIAVDSAHLFVADGAGGLRVFDIRNPAHPMPSCSLPVADVATAVELNGNILYLSEGHGVKIIDVSDLPYPVEIGFLSTFGEIADLEYSNGILYAAIEEKGVGIYDVSDVQQPGLASFYEDTLFGALDIEISGSYLTVAKGKGGIVRLNVSDPTTPDMAGEWRSPGSARAIAVRGDIVHIADGMGGYRSVLTQNIDPWVPIGSFHASVNSVSVVGNYAYLGSGHNGMQIVDISTPSTPAVLATHLNPNFAEDYCGVEAAVNSRIVYTCDVNFGFRVLDIGNWQSPQLFGQVGSSAMASLPYNLARNDHTVHLLHSSGDVQPVFNLGAVMPIPYAPYTPQGGANGVAVVNNDLFVTTGLGLDIIDVTNPSSVTLRQHISLPGGGWGVAVANGYAYVGTLNYVPGSGSGLYVVDISDPLQPILQSFTPTTENLPSLAVFGNHVAAAAGTQGLIVFDVTNALYPVEVGHYRSQGWAWDIDVEGQYAYLATGLALEIFDLGGTLSSINRGETPPQHIALGNAFPNPFNPTTTISFTMAKQSHVVLTLFNILGEKVATLVDRPLSAGDHDITLDGSKLTSGMYIYRLTADNFMDSRKVYLMK